MSKKIYVLDTSVYLTDFKSLKAFDNNDVVIPLKVLEELDKHKKRQDAVGSNARQIIRIFDEMRASGSLYHGVKIVPENPNSGVAYVHSYDESCLPSEWDSQDPDNQIIATALTLKNKNPETPVIMVSRDINLRVKCDSVDLKAQDYQESQVVESLSEVYTGFKKIPVTSGAIDSFYVEKELEVPENIQLYPHQFVLLVAGTDEKKSAIAIYDAQTDKLQKPHQYKKEVWGVKPRNKEQNCALNLLMNPDIKLVSLIGKAGSGKTLCAMAAGLEQTISESKTQMYTRMIVSRPVQPLGKDIGFLPGTMEEKMAPWLKPIQDNLQFLMGNDSMTLDMYVEHGKIEVEALTYIRGRSISNAYIIIDEAQNLTQHELKTIITLSLIHI